LGNENTVVAKVLFELSVCLVYQDDSRLAEAESASREALGLQRKLLGKDHPDIAKSLFNLGSVQTLQGNWAEGETTCRETIAMWRSLLATNRVEFANAMNNLALMLRAQGKLLEAEIQQRDALRVQRTVFGDDHKDVAVSLVRLAWILLDEHNLEEAEATYEEALPMLRRQFGNEHAWVSASLTTLANVLEERGNLGDAECLLREAVAIKRKLRKPEDPDLVGSLYNLVAVLAREGKLDEGENLLSDLLAPAFLTQPKSAQLVRERGNLRARLGHWTAAAADFSRLVEFEPENHEAYHALAPLLVQSGDLQGYRLHCARELACFAGTSDPNAAERMAKDCLILADSGVDLSAVSALADTAVSAGKDSNDLPWFQFCKGLAEYRQGRFTSAVDWAQKALSHPGDPAVRDVESFMILAMAQRRSNSSGDARASLAKGVEIADRKLPKLASGDLGDGWLDWTIAELLMREAKALIEGPAAAAAAPSTPH
jgi:tetratricopeptide (TPR) repeat protein